MPHHSRYGSSQKGITMTGLGSFLPLAAGKMNGRFEV